MKRTRKSCQSWQLSDLSVYQFYVCPECDYKSASDSDFCKHMRENHKVLDLKNEQQHQPKVISFSKKRSVEAVKEEQEEEKPKLNFGQGGISVDCNSCGFKCKSIIELRNHINDIHSTSASKPPKTEGKIDEDLEHISDLDDEDPNYEPPEADTMDWTDDEIEEVKPKEEVVKAKIQPQKVKKIEFESSIKVRCKHCNEDFKNYRYLKTHHEKSHDNLDIDFTKRIVKILNELTGQEDLIEEIDGKETTFKCDHCDFITVDAESRGLHMRSKHNDVSKLVEYSCDKCDFTTGEKRRLKSHQEKHQNGTLVGSWKKSMKINFAQVSVGPVPKNVGNGGNFECGVCWQKFTSHSVFKQHFDDLHMKENGPRKNQIINKVRCSHCNTDFRSYFYLKNHHDKTHGEELEILFTKRTVRVLNEFTGEEELIKEMDGKDATYKCTHCDYTTTDAEQRGIHMRSEHRDTSKMVSYRCDKCEFRCRDKRRFQAHKVKHDTGVFDPGRNVIKYRFIQCDTGVNEVDHEAEDMKIQPTRVVLQCSICDPARDFRYFHVLKGSVYLLYFLYNSCIGLLDVKSTIFKLF